MAPTAPAPPTAAAPVRRLTVLYDAECSLCTHVRDWLLRQPRLVPLEPVPAGSDEARRRFPGLDHSATLDEVTAVGDAGQVYRGAAAWIVVLWALREHRRLAHRLSTPTGARLARGVVLAAAKWRGAQRRWGGQGYRRAGIDGGGAKRLGEGRRSGDGWVYEPRLGWRYTGPGCDDGTCASR
ncbi:thiol-disulfide oxidoreductase DCC family protein [Streptomyces sp. MH13]|uniref:thiol-disulfide oxidoreductase DCC family protein n=1 Tax=Streptomyces sp. MH13 TaxID=3417651 RepID=UPI003CFA90DA